MKFVKFAIVCSVIPLLFLRSLQAEDIEERLERLERQVNRLIEILLQMPASEEAVGELQDIRQALEEIRPAPSIQPPPQGQTEPPLTATVVSTPVTDYEEPVQMLYSGYMEFHLNKDNLGPATLDFHRFVLLFGHGFGSRIRFWSELELEHAFVEGGEVTGELELEQAFLDFLIHPKFNFRTGMLLAPVGIINERHEPPSFHGVERPFVDTFILPTTWFGTGAGLVGDLGGGFSYKAYAMSSLDALEFSADEGLRDGRQKGFLENARNPALTGRLEYRRAPGLNLGASFWTGETGFNFRDLNGRLNVYEADGRYRWGRLENPGSVGSNRFAAGA